MADNPSSKPSFSPYRKWGMGLQMALIVCVVFAVLVMVNYIAAKSRYDLTWYVSGKTRIPLSPRTVSLLQGLTNNVRVVLYYDREEPFYSTVRDLLKEYSALSPRLSVQEVDFTRDPGAAQQLKAKYSFLAAPQAKNLVIFDCDGRGVKFVEGNALTKYVLEQLVPLDNQVSGSVSNKPPQMPSEAQRRFRRKPTTFEGERAFTATLLQVTSPNPLKACFLKGHGEHEIDSPDKDLGYLKLATVLKENYIQVESLSLLGTNTVPPDCSLLVVGGPTTPISEMELEKIEQYLQQGGRLLALFNFLSLRSADTGLEQLLARWGVEVLRDAVVDPDNTMTAGSDIIVPLSSTHPVVNPLMGQGLHMILPRPVGKAKGRSSPVDAPQVTEVAFSGPNSKLQSAPETEKRRAYPLLVAVEKGAIKGVTTERGTTRILACGDSIFLGNKQIDSAANRDFAAFAANWLMDRPHLLTDVGPRPVTEYRLIMSNSQLRAAEWLLLGAMPAAALAIGSLVWVRRRR